MGLLTQLFDVNPLCVENNTIFTQMLENNTPFVRNKRILCSGANTAAEALIPLYFCNYQNAKRLVMKPHFRLGLPVNNQSKKLKKCAVNDI